MTMPTFNIFILNTPEIEPKKALLKTEPKQKKNKLRQALEKEPDKEGLGEVLSSLKNITNELKSLPRSVHAGGG